MQRADKPCLFGHSRIGHPYDSGDKAIMESAIPSHLECPRTRQRRVPDDYAPPYPAWVARHRPSVKQVVMAYFGVQYRGAGQQEQAAA